MVTLAEAVAAQHPGLDHADEAIASGRVRVGGRPALNPRARVAVSAVITVEPEVVLRGSAKLEAALEAFTPGVEGRVALDCGAAAGGFTVVLLRHGASRVYAVDAGYGQLRGGLRQDPRVVNLERSNLGDLTPDVIPDIVELVTLDLSYLSLARAVPELARIRLAADAELLALVKPMFELGLATPPDDPDQLAAAVAAARRGAEDAGWHVVGEMESPVRGARGAAEFFVHARR
jgi:23S rRNA (cytidine1920-2'-O)/16S rRNA (cytidine1409-2'-O)-methyltransferase